MTALYVPPTDESDHKKQNMSIQNIGAQTSTNTTNTATNTANIATNTTNIASNTTNITALQAPNYGLVNGGGSLGVSLSTITASLGADVLMNNTANYFDGPSVAQGASGTWLVSGTVTFTDSTGSTNIVCKLWDGTTVIASANTFLPTAGSFLTQSLSGVITSPTGNIRISCRDTLQTTGKIVFNQSGNSKDSTISAIRIA